jgi:hypothetical protein
MIIKIADNKDPKQSVKISSIVIDTAKPKTET